MAAQKQRDSRWVTIREPYDHYWPSRAVTHYPPGEYLVKNAVADGAIAKGKGTEGKTDGSSATPPPKRRKRSAAKKRTTSRTSRAKKATDAKAADTRTVAPVGDASAAEPDRPADRPAVDSDAG